MRVGVSFEEQPWEVQQKMIHELEVKKRRDMFSHAPHNHHDHEEQYIYGNKKSHRGLEDIRKQEIGKRFREQYNAIE